MPNLSEQIQAIYKQHGTAVEVVTKRKVFWILEVATSHGWLWIDLKNGYWHVSLTSDKDSHNRAPGHKAYALDVLKDGRIAEVWETAINFWPVNSPKHREEVIQRMQWAIRIVFDRLEPSWATTTATTG